MSKRSKSEAPVDADFTESDLVVADIERVATEPPPPFEEIPPPPADPVLLGGGGLIGGSVEITVLPPGLRPDWDKEPEAPAPERDINGACAAAIYHVYHKALQGLPYPDFDKVSAAQNVAWRAVAQYVVASDA